MAKYQRQEFVNNSTTLTAEHLNHIEDGIIANQKAIEEVDKKIPADYAPKDHTHSDYAPKDHTHSQYLTEHQRLDDYAKKNELPTKTSQLTNDSGYITSVPQEVAVQNNQPTSSALWVDIDSTDEINLAEIDDNTVSDEKTWSSTKISREIANLGVGATQEQIEQIETNKNNIATLQNEVVNLETNTLKQTDKQSIVQDVIDSVIFIEGSPNPNVYAIYGEVMEDNTVLLHGSLDENKNYFIKYENEDGTINDIGELKLMEEERIIQCAYIESKDMTSYVDLGYLNTETTGMQVTFEITESGTYSNVSYFGNSDIVCGSTSANSDMRAYIGGVKSYQLIATPTVDTEYIVGVNYQNSGKASFNGSVKNMNSGTKTFKKSETLTLCKQNGGANYSRGYYVKIKEAFISEGADIVKHYVPAYRSTDGAIGVLETNTNEFIVGVGNFVKGADV